MGIGHKSPLSLSYGKEKVGEKVNQALISIRDRGSRGLVSESFVSVQSKSNCIKSRHKPSSVVMQSIIAEGHTW